MATHVTRRHFIQVSAATAAAAAVGLPRWGWAVEGSPFGPLQDDPLLRLPEGFSYTILAETGDLLVGGRGPATRPHFPDLNVTFPMPDGKCLLATSHEVPAEFPLGQPPPQEEYDHAAGGAITSLLLNPDLSIAETAYNAGGMVNNCSGGKTPWQTVLTGEEATATLEADHGFIWEVDPIKNTKTRLDACGRFEHETAVVDQRTGIVYLTEDSGKDSLLYRLRPKSRGQLAAGGILEAYRANGSWARIRDPLGESGKEPAAQGIEKNALKFARLEGGRFRGRWFYFTETEDDSACGKVWRLNIDRGKLELWAQGSGKDESMCMPDNLVFDAAGNLFVAEDKGAASNTNPNRVWFIDRDSGEMALFAELVVENQSPGVNLADEPTGPAFGFGKSVLFLNLQRADGVGKTLAIQGPFAKRARGPLPNARPRGAEPPELTALAQGLPSLSLGDLSLGAAAAMVSLRRRGRIDEIAADLEDVAADLGDPAVVEYPYRRRAKQL